MIGEAHAAQLGTVPHRRSSLVSDAREEDDMLK